MRNNAKSFFEYENGSFSLSNPYQLLALSPYTCKQTTAPLDIRVSLSIKFKSPGLDTDPDANRNGPARKHH